MKDISSYLSLGFDGNDTDSQKEIQENFLKECEEIVIDYVSSNVRFNTNKVHMFEELEKLQAEDGIFYKQETCETVESIMPDKIAEKVLKIYSEGLSMEEDSIKTHISNLLQDAFSDIIFLSSISMLQSIFEKKELKFHKQKYYENLLCKYKNLSQIIELLDEKDNIAIEELKEDMPVHKDNIINTVDKLNNLFNVRIFMQKQSVSLSPEGYKLQNYIKSRKEKVYSKEDMEKIVYKNSHRLIQSFNNNLQDNIEPLAVIPLSDKRNKMLSFEYKRVWKKFQQNGSLVFDINKVFEFESNKNNMKLQVIEAGGETGGYPKRPEQDWDFPATFGRHFAENR